MARHSKWANIKHRKGAADAKRGKVFTRMSKLITVAAQNGGGDPEMNPSLRVAIQKAKAVNLPIDNIERAIKKGTGELKDGARMEEVVYEGYGPGGVALYIRCLTDNTNRAFSNIRTVMNKLGGSLGSSGCVGWMFQRRGVISAVLPEGVLVEELELRLIDAGAEDIFFEGGEVEVLCPPELLETCEKVFGNIPLSRSEVSFIAFDKKNLVGEEQVKQFEQLVARLEEEEDVDEVFSNAELLE